MKKNRRDFLKTGLTGLGVTGAGLLPAIAHGFSSNESAIFNSHNVDASTGNSDDISMIGEYGKWAASLTESKLPSLSFRNKWPDPDTWKAAAKKRLTERLAMPNLGATPTVTTRKKYTFDKLQIEELVWQLPYGKPTEAILLKPEKQSKPLPGVLAFHDHGGNKYFGTQKITRTSNDIHPLITKHQERYYEGLAWANELAKKGYVVLVSDAFSFASRRVMLHDVPEHMKRGLTDPEYDDAAGIEAYNDWAGQHEHIMAKSLFSAGTTWPGVFLAEDIKALDVLCARTDVDATRVGCAGLSGGGLRTVLLGGFDPRIKCAVSVGFMTTWKDFLLYKCHTHTWMIYIPLLPNELDFPEILSLRAPLPALVLNNSDDSLFTLPEMQRADQILNEVYKKAGAEDRYKCSFHPGPHKFDAAMQVEAFDWLGKWLS